MTLSNNALASLQANGTSTTAYSSNSNTRSDASSLGQDDFLKLMMEQLQNQDPFNPTDNTQFISQMAQLTSVSGISEMNSNLAPLTSSMYSTQMLDASSLIGKDVLVDSDVVVLPDEGGVSGRLTLPSSTSAVDVEVLAPSGEVLAKLALGPQSAGDVEFEWNGEGLNGERLPPGNYEIRAQFMNGGSVEAIATQVRSPVESVSLAYGVPALNIDGLGSFALSEVQQIR